MSLTSWITIYVVDIFFFGWLSYRDRQLKNEGNRIFFWLFFIVITSGWFIVGLIYPETRLFIFVPSS